MSNKYVYQIPDSQFIDIVKTSRNIREALINMGLVPKGGNYSTFKNRCKKLNVSIPVIAYPHKYKEIRKQTNDNDIFSACKNAQSCRQALSLISLAYTTSNIRWLKRKIANNNICTSHWLGQGHLRGKTHNWNHKAPLSEVLVANRLCSSSKLKQRLIKENMIQNQCAVCGISSWLGKELVLHLDHVNGVHDDNRIENIRLLCPNCHSQTHTYCGKNRKKSNAHL